MKKIKVAQIITRMIVGGAQENTLQTARELAKDPKYQVTLITGPGLGPEGNLLEKVGPRDKFDLIVLNQLRREINPIRDFIAFCQLIRLCWGKKFDLVHTHSSKAGILGRWAAWLTRCPIRLHTIHGWEFHPYQSVFKRHFYIFLERWTAKITTRLVAVSKQNILKGLEAKIGSSRQYLCIYSGIDLSLFKGKALPKKWRDDSSLPSNKFVIGTIGRLAEQKNPLLMVQIAADLRKKEKNVFFVMVGDGPLRGKVEKKIKQLNLVDTFCLPGIQDDVPNWIRSFDLFLLPSKWEGLPRVLLQAMAAGKPVVATDTDGILEVIHDRENGWLVSSKKPQEWVKAILRLKQHPKERQLMAQNAKQLITKKFSDAKMIRDLKQLFEETLERNSK